MPGKKKLTAKIVEITKGTNELYDEYKKGNISRTEYLKRRDAGVKKIDFLHGKIGRLKGRFNPSR